MNKIYTVLTPRGVVNNHCYLPVLSALSKVDSFMILSNLFLPLQFLFPNTSFGQYTLSASSGTAVPFLAQTKFSYGNF